MINIISTAKVQKNIDICTIIYFFFASLDNFNYLCSKNPKICAKIKKNWTKFGN